MNLKPEIERIYNFPTAKRENLNTWIVFFNRKLEANFAKGGTL
jgi:hypothetical protein